MNKQNQVQAGVGALALVVALSIVWFVQAPGSALHAVKLAAQQHNMTELNELVDFPSLRSSVKFLVIDTVNAQLGNSKSMGASLTRMFTGLVAGPAVDYLVTPESLASMFSGEVPRAGRGSDVGTQAQDNDNVVWTKTWDGISTVRIRAQSAKSADNHVVFVMRRNGLAWRLSGIEQ